MGRQETREKLVNAAADLFYEQGINPTGIDRIVERSGLSKPTLYQHFRSKEDLVTAVVDCWCEAREKILAEITEDDSIKPKQRLVRVFDFYERWFDSEGFRGCGLVNSSLEIPSPDAESRRIIQRHKDWVVKELTRLARAARLKAPKKLAESLAQLIEGATVMAYLRKSSKAGGNARYAARKLIQAHDV